MRQLLLFFLLTCLAFNYGCGAQDILLGTEGSYLLITRDVLALPNEDIQLRARLQGGDLLKSQVGYVIRFYRNGKLFKAAETEEDGIAAVSFTPREPGEYRFAAEVARAGLPEEPPKPQDLLISCCKAETPMVIVDLDKTIVASGFHTVLIGNPTPMPMSSEVLRKIAATYKIIYLTHRPDYFGPKSKAWLVEHNYPSGPVLLSSTSGFLQGSGAYKSEMLRELQAKFKNIEIGIGDKISDVLAYHENGIKAFLITQIPQSDDPNTFVAQAEELGQLPKQIQVVTEWNQIDEAIFQGALFPRTVIEHQLSETARLLREKAKVSQ